MTNISKHPLAQADFDRLSVQFNAVLAKLSSKTSPLFIDELLGHEEKIMLVKRLAAIIMFQEGCSSYTVWTTLKLSPTTANTIRMKYADGEYKNIEALFAKHKTDYKKFLTVIDTILRAGLPPMAGPRRWSHIQTINGARPKRK